MNTEMKVTLLGSGDAIGMPAPMCNCEYCRESERRRRSGLLIETENSTVVVDISPDIKEQLHHEEVYDVDTFLVTHFHYDHFWGIQELNHMALTDSDHVFNPEEFDFNGWHDRKINIIGNKITLDHMEEKHHLGRVKESGNIVFNKMEKNEATKFQDLKIHTFGIDHGEEGTTQGYVIEKDGEKVVFAPDAWELEESDVYKDADLFFIEGQLFDAEGHANQAVLEDQIKEANPDRVVLLSVTEHLNQMHTEEMKEVAEEKGFEIW
ncbi:MAG: MBL fold metallo-hydrolase, partial [Candidatus Nanohalobium sp.]